MVKRLDAPLLTLLGLYLVFKDCAFNSGSIPRFISQLFWFEIAIERVNRLAVHAQTSFVHSVPAKVNIRSFNELILFYHDVFGAFGRNGLSIKRFNDWQRVHLRWEKSWV